MHPLQWAVVLSLIEQHHIHALVRTQLDGAQWLGPDAEKFRSEWKGQHVTALNQVAMAVSDAGRAAMGNANAQETTSAT